MLENAFRIAIDPLYPPPIVWPQHKKHLVPDNLLEGNRFEIIFDEMIDGTKLKTLYKNIDYCRKHILKM
jgi:hypothetical protein